MHPVGHRSHQCDMHRLPAIVTSRGADLIICPLRRDPHGRHSYSTVTQLIQRRIPPYQLSYFCCAHYGRLCTTSRTHHLLPHSGTGKHHRTCLLWKVMTFRALSSRTCPSTYTYVCSLTGWPSAEHDSIWEQYLCLCFCGNLGSGESGYALPKPKHWASAVGQFFKHHQRKHSNMCNLWRVG